MTDPVPADEPALQQALIHMLTALVLGIGGGSILVALHLTPEAGTLIISAVVAAVLHATQGWRTRNRVFSPLSAQQGPSGYTPAAEVELEPVSLHAD